MSEDSLCWMPQLKVMIYLLAIDVSSQGRVNVSVKMRSQYKLLSVMVSAAMVRSVIP